MTKEERRQKDAENRILLVNPPFDKNYMVSAGAGAGKTYTIVERAFNMMCAEYVKPSEIVMITFTRKAATEIKDRLNRWIRSKVDEAPEGERKDFLQGLLDSLPEMQISTIHSFCRKVLSAYPLKSGTGFAAQYESEEERPNDSGSDTFFTRAWKAGECERSINAGIDEQLVKGAFNWLNRRPSVRPQFIDPETQEGKELHDKIMEACRGMIRNIRESIDRSEWNMLSSRIRAVLTDGEDAAEVDVLKVGNTLAKKGVKAQKWMTCRKGDTLCKALQPFARNRYITDEDIQKAEAVLFSPGKVSKDERRGVFEALIPGLPEGFRQAAEVARLLPEEERLDEIVSNISLMRHGVAIKDALKLKNQYEEYRRESHIVTLTDMLHMTSEVVKDPEVRQELHERYKVFFVDEYQDTDPIQTDIIFAIAAREYNPDWHLSKPAPGSLFLVGDAKQAIYRFRGADIALWKEAQEVIQRTGGKVLDLYLNRRSTDEICEAAEVTFGEGGDSLKMVSSDEQAEFSGMVSHRGAGEENAIVHHIVTSANPVIPADFGDAAVQIAEFIQERVRNGRNRYGDFLMITYNREKKSAYTDAFREYHIPIIFDGNLPMDDYPPIQRMNLRVQAVCHPFDEILAFRVLNECYGVTPQEWDLFRMNLKKLPREIIDKDEPTVHTAVFKVQQIQEEFQETEMNRKILNALEQMNNDDRLSCSRTPCAFLRELTEACDGLFMEEYPAEEYQNQYAALLHVIDTIEEQHPEHFADMADILQSYAEGRMERMPSVRADSNYVRLMNLHKVKGLEGKVVIFPPCEPKKPPIDNHVERENAGSSGWLIVKDPDTNNHKSPQYKPPEWDEQLAKENAIRDAEEIRKLYVVLTRARDEIHFFDFPEEKKYKSAWAGFDKLGGTIMNAPGEGPMIEDEETGEDPQAEREALLAAKTAVNGKYTVRITPSSLERKDELPPEDLDGEEDEGEDIEEEEEENIPGGKDWGTAIHRAAELIVTGKDFGEESIRKAAKQAVEETFRTEILPVAAKRNLQIPAEAKTLEEIQAYLADSAARALGFMADEHSEFRQEIAGAEIYAELPFVVSVTENDNKDVFFKLKAAARRTSPEETRLDIAGKIDLALRYPDGTWKIIDYKTDRMLPEDRGNREAYKARLEQQYKNQLEIYRIVLGYLTREEVKEAKLLTV